MFKSILVPTDGSYLSEQAIGNAIEFAKINPGSKIVALSVVEPAPTIAFEGEVYTNSEKYMGYARTSADSNVGKVAEAASAAGIPCETVTVTSVRPWKVIISTANEKGCDCIVMASHGRKGYNALILGSNTNKVLTHSQIPVMVFRPVMAPDAVQEPEGANYDYMGF